MTIKKKKKICLVIPSLNAGGMERVMCELAYFFCSKDFLETHLIMYGKTPGIFYEVPSKLIVHKPKSKFNDNLRFIYTIDRMVYLRKEVKKVNPDTILSFGEYWNSFVLIALYGLHYPVFISDRCSPVKKYSKYHALLRKWLYPKAKGIITQSSKAFEIYFKIFRHPNIIAIGNPIRSIDLTGYYKKENIILSIGRLIKTKHFDRLIKVFSELNTPGWKLIIVGGNALKQNNYDPLLKLINELGLEGRVNLTGEIKNVAHFYLKSKIFVFTSSSEGFPNVVGEALSAGLPVVAYDCLAGPSEMIKDGENGFLVPVFDDTELLKKINLLIKDENLLNLMSERAKNSVKEFDISIIGQKYLDFIMPSDNN